MATPIYLAFLFILFCLLCAQQQFSHAVARQNHTPKSNAIAQFNYLNQNELQTKFWLENAQASLKQRLQRQLFNKTAKNVIFFLGDGMSVATLTAARILKGQRQQRTGEEYKLAIESFPYAGLSKTYCVDAQTADSACTATAYLCGVKTKSKSIGVNAQTRQGECASNESHVESIAMWAQRAGKATGIVTTTRITHASPAGAYAHITNRNWESDQDMPSNIRSDCMDIAKQLIYTPPGRNFDVIMGGGLNKLMPKEKIDYFGHHGERLDGNDLVSEWQRQNINGTVVHTLQQLHEFADAIAETGVEQQKRVLGLFATDDMEYHLNEKQNSEQPRLLDMTAVTIKQLSQNANGYFVFIEGGRIDHGHHATKAGYALDETLEFDLAIETALNMTNADETLIIVTADHGHAMSMAGYANRGASILEIDATQKLAKDGLPYSTLNYALGLEKYVDPNGKRKDLRNVLHEKSYTPSGIIASQGVHAAEDVVIFANGPHAELFSGVMEQHLIPHLIAYAACIGNGSTYCDNI